MKDWIKDQLKNCVSRKQGGRINWEKAAYETGIPKTTLFRMFEENGNPTWKNLTKIITYTGCRISCGRYDDCLKKHINKKIKKAA